MEDNQIIKLFKDKSEEAITGLSQKYGFLCRKLASNILNSSEDVDECINDTYLAVWNSIPPNEPSSIRNYLCSTLRNLAIKKYHYNTAEKRNSSYDVALDELAETLSLDNTVESLLSSQELASYLDEFLATLDKDTRVMFVLRYWYSESVNNIAKKFGVKPNTITVKLKRTREKLHNHLISKGVNL